MSRPGLRCRHCGRSRLWHRLLYRRGSWRLYCLPPGWEKHRSRTFRTRTRARESFTPEVAADIRRGLTRYADDAGEQIALEVDV